MDFRRILLATDFSTCSLGAEDAARVLARRLSAEVVLLHVVELPPGLAPSVLVHPSPKGPVLPLGDYVTSSGKELMDKVALGFAQEGIQVRSFIEMGPVVDTVLRRAKDERADLILVGTHGRSGLRRAVLGSIAEKLVRQSAIPVLVIRKQAADHITDAEEQARIEAEG